MNFNHKYVFPLLLKKEREGEKNLLEVSNCKDINLWKFDTEAHTLIRVIFHQFIPCKSNRWSPAQGPCAKLSVSLMPVLHASVGLQQSKHLIQSSY